jgi:hypothetical protein
MSDSRQLPVLIDLDALENLPRSETHVYAC